MRIRQQAKLTKAPISNGISSAEHSSAPIGIKCQLSRSPWDVFSFPSDSPPSQIGGGGSFSPNGSFEDSIGAIERNEVAEGQIVCQRHLEELVDKSVATAVATDRRKKRVAPASNPRYFYYTGFGPYWATKRGAKARYKNKTERTNMEVDEEKKYDYIDDYESDEEDGEGEIERKRARKPIKARSLKSLM